MTINLLQVKHLIDDHLGSGETRKKDGEVSYYCPFCNHYKRKLQVNLLTQKWHCWVCDNKGQTILSLFKKSNAPAQLFKQVKDVYGDTSYNKTVASNNYVSLPEQYKPLWIPQNNPDYKNALHYVLNVRKLTPTDILRYQIGYCEEGPYAGMIVIPSFDKDGLLNYFVSRSFYKDATMSHKNPPVSKDIIGFENQINWNEPVILVEGSFDAITTKRNAIPLFGKIISPTLRSKIVTHCKRVYLALDQTQ